MTEHFPIPPSALERGVQENMDAELEAAAAYDPEDEIDPGSPRDHVSSDPTIQEAFARFDRENPHVYEQLVGLARQWQRAGHSKCGIGMLFEVLRWQLGLRTAGDDFKLNNNFRSRYVRKLMTDYPEFRGYFELRVLHAP